MAAEEAVGRAKRAAEGRNGMHVSCFEGSLLPTDPSRQAGQAVAIGENKSMQDWVR